MDADAQDTMRGGLTGSLAFHVVAILLTVVVFPSIEPDLPPIPPNIPIELVTIGEVTNIKQIDKVDEQQKDEKPEEPKPEELRQAAIPPLPEVKPAPEPEPVPAPPPPPEAVPEPKPAPKPEEKKVEQKPAEVKPAQVAPQPKKPPDFDPSKIAALLNKLPPKAKSETPGEEHKLSTGPQKTEAVGEANAMTASWQALINEQFKRCWNVQGGAQDAEKQIVTVHVELNPDGSLARSPEVVNAAEVALGGQTFQIAAERALRAVRACSPLKQLPPDRYSDWHEMDFVFDPRRMLGG
jgi:outer membrane biosynthesis protein TonB